jgi:ubiquinone/menaquinone biosynthesis C-methylase UbiE
VTEGLDATAACRAAYDRWAESYDAQDNPLVAMTTIAMRTWTPAVGARVLEVGCGTGRNADFFLARGAAGYVGLDASPNMLARARARELPRCTFVEIDFNSPWPLPSSSQDVVLFCLALEHVARLDAPFREAARVLRSGGELRAYELHAELHEGGFRAHFRDGDREIALPSFAHDAADFARSFAATSFVAASSIEHVVATEHVTASAKLGKHLGRRILLEASAIASAL